MIESDSLRADGHVFGGVAIGISNDLVVIRVLHTVQVKEVFDHLWKTLV